MKAIAWALAGLSAVLVATGIPLLWLYRPGEAGPNWLEVVHQSASFLAIQVALVLLVVVAAQRATRRQSPWALAILVLLAGLSFTGYLLPWDQLALWAVTVGTEFRGALAVLRDDVRFVLIGDVEVSTGTYTFWLAVHAIVLPILTVAVTAGWRRSVGRRAAPAGRSDLRHHDAGPRDGDPQPDA